MTDPEAGRQKRAGELVHAESRVEAWAKQWAESGRCVLLLDFDGTLAPIVPRPEDAAMLPATRDAVALLLERGAEIAVVSGRGLADARERIGIQQIAYAGNHGMEIEGPDIHQVHADAAAARPELERAGGEVARELEGIAGAFVEDKGLTLSVHFRLVADEEQVTAVRRAVDTAVADRPALRVTEGKKVLEIRPRVEWDKGRAVLFLLDQLDPPPGTPVVYIGDDRTDEDAFRALREWGAGEGEGVIVADRPPTETAARSFVRTSEEVSEVLLHLARSAPPH